LIGVGENIYAVAVRQISTRTNGCLIKIHMKQL